MHKKTKIGVLLGLLGTILVGCLAWFSGRPATSFGNVSVALLGYTKGNSGEALAIIAVTNLSANTVFAYRPTIQIQSPAAPRGFTNYFPGNTNQWTRFHSMLDSGASSNFTLAPPASPPCAWRLSLLVYSDFGALQIVKRTLFGRHMPTEITSDWIVIKQEPEGTKL